jgi:membrane-associated protein
MVGAMLWITSLSSLAFFLGKEFPQIENYIGYIVIGLITITTIPVLMTYLKNRKK